MSRSRMTFVLLGLIGVLALSEVSCVPIFSFPDFSNFHSFFPDLQPETKQDPKFAEMERIIMEESANGDISHGNLEALKGSSKDKIAMLSEKGRIYDIQRI